MASSSKNWYQISFVLPPSSPFGNLSRTELHDMLKGYPFKAALLFSVQSTDQGYKLVVFDTEENVRQCTERLKPLLQISNVEITENTMSPPATRLNVPHNLPELAKRILSQEHSLQSVTHDSFENALQATITPFKYESHVLLLVKYKVDPGKLPKNVVHNCVLVAQTPLPLMKTTSDIFGVDRRDNETSTFESTRELGAELEISEAPSVKATGSIGTSTKSEKPLYQFFFGKDEEIHDGAAVGLRISKRAKKAGVGIHNTVVFLFDLSQDLPTESIQVDSHFLVERRSLKPPFKVQKRDTLSFTLHISQVRSNPSMELVIGGVVGYPQSGKTSFISTMMERSSGKRVPLTWTPYLRRHLFRDFNLPDGKTCSFVFLDTRGYYFEPELIGDQKLLNLFVKGLAYGTDFSKKMNLDEVKLDPSNSPTHLILAVPVRDAYSGATWLGSFFGGGTTTPHLEKLIKLYHLMLDALATNNPNMDIPEAKSRVAIVITHMDMLSEAQRSEARRLITSKFEDAGAPSNYIFFGQKECTWKERDLVAHEQKVAKFLETVPTGEEYWKVLEEKDYPMNWLHIKDSECTKLNCEHKFTADTQRAFLDLLHTFLSTFQ